jgi:small-conductance mechanosensitive channel
MSENKSSEIQLENKDDSVFNRLVITVVYIFLAFLAIRLVQDNISFVVQKLNNYGNKTDEHYQKKNKTIERLSSSIFKTVIIIVTSIFVLTIWGISVSPFLAGAGILGITVGLGAQTFLKDIINGLNIMISGKMNIGDHVVIKNFSGVVTDISINSTSLKSYDGRDIIIPNGFIDVIEIHVK